jgi:glyoxylase-like metal-dependent hydrolase (beta-lactamase superfamily II)/ferredoxin
MARLAHKLPQNAPGEFFVDASCIDCETCRQVAPAVFARSPEAGQSVVSAQPHDDAALERASMALVACPTASIGTVHKLDVRRAARAFPEPLAPDVFYCGYASEASYGASSYFLRRPDGNVLVDSPRAATPLVTRLRELGGARWMFLTHRDDVADHARFHQQLGCERILHADDVSGRTREVEHQIEGTAPHALAPDLLALPVPGHTRGSTALLFRGTYLFTGDHLWADEDDGRLGMGRSVCWYSWPEQVRSLERLLDYDFTWVLPGHGRPFHAASPGDMRGAIRRLLAELH